MNINQNYSLKRDALKCINPEILHDVNVNTLRKSKRTSRKSLLDLKMIELRLVAHLLRDLALWLHA